MACWEYDIKMIRMDKIDTTKEDLNSLGIDGWELIKFDGQLDSAGKTAGYFKRLLDGANI
ncbi:hypothetical protein HNV12_07255 [Methanococcoides sp. SA1]|nr:hypothetical protein [Methanococcoides sp. SA1]